MVCRMLKKIPCNIILLAFEIFCVDEIAWIYVRKFYSNINFIKGLCILIKNIFFYNRRQIFTELYMFLHI